MGLIRETWRGFWESRKARYQAAALKEQAEAARQKRRAELAGKGYLSPSEVMESHLLEAANPAVMEGTQLASIWDWLRPWRDLNDQLLDFTRGGLGSPNITNKTRRNGSDFPFFRTEQDLGILRDTARLTVKTIPEAEGLLNGIRHYTIGNGSTNRVTGRDDQDETALILATQKVIDQFCRRNRWFRAQHEFFNFSRRDGEGIWRLFFNGDGTTEIRHVYSEQIRAPHDANTEEWGFGVRCDPDDATKRIEFAVYPLNGDTEICDIVPAEEIIFLAPNADPGVRRGVPDFVWGMGDALAAADKLATNMGEGSAQQAAIAYIRQHSSGTPASTIQAFASSEADYTKPNIFTGTDRQIKEAVPGTIVDTNKNTDFLASPYNAGIPAHIEVYKMLTRRAVVRYHAPEWMVNADASSNSYANALAQESPFIMATLEMQQIYTETFRDLFERVIRHAINCGILPPDALDRVEIIVTLPSPIVRDSLKEAQRAEIELRDGTTSPQIEAELQGREWNKVQNDRKLAQASGWEPPNSGQSNSGNSSGQDIKRDSEDTAGTGDGGNGDDNGLDMSADDLIESIEVGDTSLMEAGFTGTITDKIGRKRTYVDGHMVKGNRSGDKKSNAQPPPLPHQQTQQSAVFQAKSLIAAIANGEKGNDLAEKLDYAISSIDNHRKEGDRAIERMAIQKYGDTQKAKDAAEIAKQKFSAKLDRVKQILIGKVNAANNS